MSKKQPLVADVNVRRDLNNTKTGREGEVKAMWVSGERKVGESACVRVTKCEKQLRGNSGCLSRSPLYCKPHDA